MTDEKLTFPIRSTSPTPENRAHLESGNDSACTKMTTCSPATMSLRPSPVEPTKPLNDTVVEVIRNGDEVEPMGIVGIVDSLDSGLKSEEKPYSLRTSFHSGTTCFANYFDAEDLGFFETPTGDLPHVHDNGWIPRLSSMRPDEAPSGKTRRSKFSDRLSPAASAGKRKLILPDTTFCLELPDCFERAYRESHDNINQ